ncbi:trans-resveratrol di-o-methyltransferase [Quercus suber]|uniref:Trans-resveratrol di-o-methyltransferase n=1 Tax=Quercus suber TaxID=58331 RepID=A0AAW0JIU2_QUESU
MVIKNFNEDEKSTETQLFFDMLMMVLVTRRERNEKEWAKLFLNASFRDYKLRITGVSFSKHVDNTCVGHGVYEVENVVPKEHATKLLHAQAHIWKMELWNHIFNFINTMSLKRETELAIPDIIHNHGKRMTLFELICTTNSPYKSSKCLSCLKRILNHSDFFVQRKIIESDEEGGGIRTVAKTVADAFPNMKCTVFDLLQVVMDLQGSHVRYMPSPSKGVLAIRDQIVKKKRIASSSSKKDKYLNAISLKNKIVIATDISNEPF